MARGGGGGKGGRSQFYSYHVVCPKSFLALYHPVPGVKIAGMTQRKVSGKNSEGGSIPRYSPH